MAVPSCDAGGFVGGHLLAEAAAVQRGDTKVEGGVFAVDGAPFAVGIGSDEGIELWIFRGEKTSVAVWQGDICHDGRASADGDCTGGDDGVAQGGVGDCEHGAAQAQLSTWGEVTEQEKQKLLVDAADFQRGTVGKADLSAGDTIAALQLAEGE